MSAVSRILLVTPGILFKSTEGTDTEPNKLAMGNGQWAMHNAMNVPTVTAAVTLYEKRWRPSPVACGCLRRCRLVHSYAAVRSPTVWSNKSTTILAHQPTIFTEHDLPPTLHLCSVFLFLEQYLSIHYYYSTMGRRLRGANLRAAQRSKLAAEEIVETTASEVQTKQVVSKKNEELFVIDTKAVLPSKKQQAKQEAKKKRNNPSVKEQGQIEKLVQAHSAEGLQKLVQDGQIRRRQAKLKGQVKPTFDLWGQDEAQTKVTKSKKNSKSKLPLGVGGTKPEKHVVVTTRPALPAPISKAKTVTVEVAKPGQSYNPDKVEHNKALQDAVKVETKRQQAEKEKTAPLSKGMTAETRALLVGDSDDSDSEKEEPLGDDLVDMAMSKQNRKFTRAERNKQKRLRAEQWEIQSRKRQKKLEKSVGEAKHVSKQLKKKEIEQSKRRTEIENLKADGVRTRGVDVYERLAEENPITAPTYPVALRSELKQTGGSLRSIKPKGSLLHDRLSSLADREMAAKKQVKKRKQVQGKRRKAKLKVRGKGYAESREGAILG